MDERRSRRHRLTYANVAATLALLLAISGTAYGAAGWITSRDITNGTIKPIDMNAQVWATALPSAVSGYKDNFGVISGAGETTIGTLSLWQGSWVLFAKLTLWNEGAGTTVHCALRMGTDYDVVGEPIEMNIATDFGETAALNMVHTATGTEDATLSCNPHGGNVHVFDVKMTAINVGFMLNGSL